ncbi:MAG TPA: hypothetical protein VH092_06270 [Urbifossiella sp.]|nr:hypothetical protein [Urbifossiella sp.]
MFEVVHTLPDWYDGPRGGIADYQGYPHLFASEWSDQTHNYADTFLLSPVSPETFTLALEDWAIWRRSALSVTSLVLGREVQQALLGCPDFRRG